MVVWLLLSDPVVGSMRAMPKGLPFPRLSLVFNYTIIFSDLSEMKLNMALTF